MLARELRRRVPDVTGIDLDEMSIELAGAQNVDDRIRYVRGDFLTYPFEPASFDVVTTVAALHHMDVAAALARVRDLLKPGGVLCAIGLARSQLPRDIPIEVAGVVSPPSCPVSTAWSASVIVTVSVVLSRPALPQKTSYVPCLTRF
jgi:SAM-dependent methyltransferase